MTHQYLLERGESPKHEDAPWCREIMRLHRAISGKVIWAAPETVAKRVVNGKRKSVRVQPACPQGAPSLSRDAIGRWPHSVGLDLGPLLRSRGK
jgi:hypothetical protein